jgi:prepilin-type N-terminal cleavage/methylation domain-containing protein
MPSKGSTAMNGDRHDQETSDRVSRLSPPPGRGAAGFTLIELLIVVTVILILVTMSASGYMLFRKKAMTVEARMALSTIYKLEHIYKAEFDKFTNDLTLIGFKMDGPARYSYFVLYATSDAFKARAIANIDRDPEKDIWTVDEKGFIVHELED